ncbi:Phosphoserine aminotransferase [Amphibalanus amphitrite]|uniref:Phosphoserine aminotransferase n=1 Tax=Amphibalanus amphitrite TaxID=1232801 RepID=A0A6A4W2J9_AMPAM|nr:Phosphoserine aminotransferase [Amphibalanus amphitrite]
MDRWRRAAAQRRKLAARRLGAGGGRAGRPDALPAEDGDGPAGDRTVTDGAAPGPQPPHSAMEQPIVFFGPGPSKIPDQVLERVQAELLNYAGTGVSVMEISHRSAEFQQIISGTETRLRRLLHIPDNYRVLFVQGGATGQFAAVPLNLCVNGKADYFITGTWSKKAAAEAARYLDMQPVLPATEKFLGIAGRDQWRLRPDADYVYYCDNETVEGVEFQEVPDTGDVPLVADMSSNILTRPIDVSKFGVIFAGAQKNMGPAGLTIVIVREDLLGRGLPVCPSVLSYSTMAKAGSLYNTPPCFNVYVTGKVLDWVEEQGGVEEMSKRSDTKAKLIYTAADQSDGFYVAPVDGAARSRTTVQLRISAGAELEKKFLKEAEEVGFKSLKGHRSVGGLRVALFNALTVPQIEKLVKFLGQFATQNRG